MSTLNGVLRKKIQSDLFSPENRNRTLQSVLSIVAGAFALGAIVGALQLISADVSRTWQAAWPASILMRVHPGAAEDVVKGLETVDDVEAVEGQMVETIKWRRDSVSPWETATLKARADYQDMIYFRYRLEAGVWPTRDSLAVSTGFNLNIGDRVELEIADRQRTIDIGGLLFAADAPSAQVGGVPTFYTTEARFINLTSVDGFGQVNGGVQQFTEAHAETVAATMEDKLERQGYIVSPGGTRGRTVVSPDEHPSQETLDGIFLILIVMAVASLILGMLLVYNTISAIIGQQVPQIGVLKAIGASRSQILLVYFVVVLIYGVLALLLAVPLGALGAHGFRLLITNMLNIERAGFAISGSAVFLQAFVSLAAPLLVSIVPIFSGAGITVREAISSYGLSGGGGWLDELLSKLTFLSRIVSMSISNTFRNKLRVSLVLLTLIGAGAMFMGVMGTRSSVAFTFRDVYLSVFASDIKFALDNPERISAIKDLTLAHPAVETAEMRFNTPATLRGAEQAEDINDEDISLTGIPVPSISYQVQLRAGRWLEPTDTHAIVLTEGLARDLAVNLRDWIIIEISGKPDTTWQVVGLLYEPGISDKVAYVPYLTLSEDVRQVEQANQIWINATTQDIEQTARELRNLYEAQGLDVLISGQDTLRQESEERISSLQILIYLLLAVAVLIAVVGGIALSGTLSINILERRREIGVLRSIGAGNRAIGTLFITEGLLIGWFSWLIAIPVSYPVGVLLTQAVAGALNFELIFDYAAGSIVLWLIVVTALAILASWAPTRGAIEVSVRESLSYE